MTARHSTSHKHGPRLSAAEYDRRVVALHRGMPSMPDTVEDARLRRQELEIRIDHLLGTGFPAERREQLWQAQQRLERQRLRSFWAALLPRALGSGVLARYVSSAYAQVLDPEELAAFLGGNDVVE